MKIVPTVYEISPGEHLVAYQYTHAHKVSPLDSYSMRSPYTIPALLAPLPIQYPPSRCRTVSGKEFLEAVILSSSYAPQKATQASSLFTKLARFPNDHICEGLNDDRRLSDGETAVR